EIRDEIAASVKESVAEAADFAENSPHPDVSTLFDYTYATPVPNESRRMPADPVFAEKEKERTHVCDHLPPGSAGHTARRDAPRRERPRHGRGDRCLRGLLQDHRGSPQRIRPQEGQGHPDR